MNEPRTREEAEFYYHFGRAIAAWQSVEDQLCDTFMRALAGSNHWTVAAIFYVPKNLHTRIDMVDVAIRRATADESIIKEWIAIRNKITRIMGLRTNLAHSHAWANTNGENWHASPSIYHDQRRKRMSAEDIQNAERKFHNAADRIEKFAISLGKHLRQHGEAVQPLGTGKVF